MKVRFLGALCLITSLHLFASNLLCDCLAYGSEDPGSKQSALTAARAARAKIDLVEHLEKCKDEVQESENLLNAGDWRGAIKSLLAVIQDDGRNEIANYDLAIAYYHLGEYQQAYQAIAHSLQLNAKYPPSYVHLSTIKAKFGDVSGAEHALLKAVELDPSLINSSYDGVAIKKRLDMIRGQSNGQVTPAGALVNQAEYLWQNGQVEESQKLVLSALKLEPQNSEAHRQLADLIANQGNLDQAIVEARKAASFDPRNLSALFKLGELLSSRGMWNEAQNVYNKAHQLDASSMEALVGQALAQANLGNMSYAKETMQQLAHLNPESVWPKIGMASILLAEGEPEFAQDQLNRAVKIDSNNLRVRSDLASISFQIASNSGRKKDWSLAAEQYRELLKIAPYQLQAYLRLAVALTNIGDLINAEKALVMAVQIAPNNASCHTALSVVLKSQGENKLAREHAKIALKLNPHDQKAKAVLTELDK